MRARILVDENGTVIILLIGDVSVGGVLLYLAVLMRASSIAIGIGHANAMVLPSSSTSTQRSIAAPALRPSLA